VSDKVLMTIASINFVVFFDGHLKLQIMHSIPTGFVLLIKHVL